MGAGGRKTIRKLAIWLQALPQVVLPGVLSTQTEQRLPESQSHAALPSQSISFPGQTLGQELASPTLLPSYS